MKKNTLKISEKPGMHLGIIMDGNGRWAKRKNKPRFYGHRIGAETLRKIVEAAPNQGISVITAYAFSSDNWKRPADEVKSLMKLFQYYLKNEIERLKKKDVRFSIIGRRDRFSKPILNAIEKAEKETAGGKTLHLRLAVDYSARDSIVRAAKLMEGQKEVSRESFSKALAEAQHDTYNVPDIDLLIRTGGEQRLSDFLLWECAYAEFFFSKKMWPEFGPNDLQEAMFNFHNRERRFGTVPQSASG